MNQKQHRTGIIYLLFVSLFWGSTFAVLKGAVDEIHPLWLVLLRFGTALPFFLPFLRGNFATWKAGMELGFWIWLIYTTQTIGLQYTTAGRSAFITALSVVLVPLLAGVFGRRRISGQVWVAAVIALLGVGFLSYDGSALNVGDLWTVLTAFAAGIHIYRLEGFSRRFRVLSLTAIQLCGVFLYTCVWAVIERPPLVVAEIPWVAILYLGVVATALTIWFMALGQKLVDAPKAAVIYSLEPVWAALFAFLLLGERLGVAGFIGGFLIVLAIVFSELRFGGGGAKGSVGKSG